MTGRSDAQQEGRYRVRYLRTYGSPIARLLGTQPRVGFEVLDGAPPA